MKFQLATFSLLLLVFVRDAKSTFDDKTELYSSSTTGLLKLLDLENRFVHNLKEYAEPQEEKLKTLQVYLKTLDRNISKNTKAQEKYVSNPLKAFGLIRRLRQDWLKLQVYTRATVGSAQLEAMQKLLADVPTKDDLKESLLGINRIELTYDLNSADISQGRLQGKQFNYTLSIRDCLAIANQKYDSKDYARAALWYRTALKQQAEPHSQAYNEVLGKPLNGVRRKLAKAHLLHGMGQSRISMNVKEAHEHVNEVLKKIDPADFNSYVNELLDENVDELALRKKKPTAHYLGCRGRFPKRTNLSCRYNSTTTPFLRLAPLKMEEISLDPYIVMYHNVLYDSEIAEMKRQAVNLQNGHTAAEHPDQKEPPEIVARVAWLVKKTPFMERINQRIKDMTGFDQHEFDSLQVANFGIGSYFKPHYDYMTTSRKSNMNSTRLGDRMASLIFYASEVPQGGATVFPDIQVAVPPQKGNSLFWFNLFEDGTQDARSLHSVCPVIVGARWTLTKWLHIAPQLFIKPCSARPSKK